MITNSELASRLQGHCLRLSYNDKDGLKHDIREAAHRLDSSSVRIQRKRDGLLIINGRGKARFMTWRERLALFILGGATEIRP